jgi:hypothetical protein
MNGQRAADVKIGYLVGAPLQPMRLDSKANRDGMELGG